MRIIGLFAFVLLIAPPSSAAPPSTQPANTWRKLSPVPGSPPSPRLGYEGACVWDQRHRLFIRHAGHNQGGGGEQHAETWTFDPLTLVWQLKFPNTAPPGVCCAQQNVYDPIAGRYLRFAAFSGSHGWQWFREIQLGNASTWSYDLATNTWRDLRPWPTVRVAGLRGAAWDSAHQVVVMFGGENNNEGTRVFDPYDNAWTKLKPPVQPASRSGGNLAYDARAGLHVLFGSQFSDDPHTWAFDLAKNQWRDLKPPTMPLTKENDAVLAYDTANGIIVAVIKVTEGKEEKAKHRLETWAYELAKNTWTKLNPPQEPDPSGSRARNLVYAPELGLFLLENRTHPPAGQHEQQIWAYKYADPAPAAALLAPTDLAVTTAAKSATLRWSPTTAPAAARIEILRGSGPQPWQIEYKRIADVPATETTFRDDTAEPGVTWFYALRTLDAAGSASGLSMKARTQPRIVEDTVVSILSAKQVEFSWKPSAAPDVVGYEVERAPVEVWSDDQLDRQKSQVAPLDSTSVGAIRRIGPFAKITPAPIRENSITDALDLSTPHQLTGPELLDSKVQGRPIPSPSSPTASAP